MKLLKEIPWVKDLARMCRAEWVNWEETPKPHHWGQQGLRDQWFNRFARKLVPLIPKWYHDNFVDGKFNTLDEFIVVRSLWKSEDQDERQFWAAAIGAADKTVQRDDNVYFTVLMDEIMYAICFEAMWFIWVSELKEG